MVSASGRPAHSARSSGAMWLPSFSRLRSSCLVFTWAWTVRALRCAVADGVLLVWHQPKAVLGCVCEPRPCRNHSSNVSTVAESPKPRTSGARSPTTSRPTAADLEAAKDRTIPDVVPPHGGVLFCGINPGLYSAATGWHFARPGNRFWPALHRSGFTDRLLRPAEQHLLPSYGLGITNLAARATAQAAELTAAELTEGGAVLEAFVRERAPRAVAVLGVTAYRTAFRRPKAAIGPQDVTLGGARLWVLPNPSGLNAHYTVDTLADEFRALRSAAGTGAPSGEPVTR